MRMPATKRPSASPKSTTSSGRWSRRSNLEHGSWSDSSVGQIIVFCGLPTAPSILATTLIRSQLLSPVGQDCILRPSCTRPGPLRRERLPRDSVGQTIVFCGLPTAPSILAAALIRSQLLSPVGPAIPPVDPLSAGPAACNASSFFTPYSQSPKRTPCLDN